MSLSILNNIPGLAAENQLNITQNNLQQTLEQLSSGSRLNSGADDAAGLSIANGLQANITALTQSSQNATDGSGKLQVADGALSQVTSLLNRAVTLATEAANGTETDTQRQALDNEFTSIKNEIDNIGSQTTYNGSAVFAAGPSTSSEVVSSATGLTSSSAISGSLVLQWGSGSGAFTSNSADANVGELITDINSSGKNLQASLNSQGQLVVESTDTSATGPTAANPLALNSSTMELGASEVSSSSSDAFTGNTNYAELDSAIGTTLAGTDTVTLTNANKFTLTWGQNGSFTASTGDTTVNALIADINMNSDGDLSASLVNGQLKVTATDGTATNSSTALTVVDTGAVIGGITGAASPNTGFSSGETSENQFNVFLSDATSTGSGSISVDLNQLGQSNINGISLSANDLTSASDAQIALTQINSAISAVASLRGNIGAGINQLNAAVDVENVQIQNLTSAESNITSADIGTDVSDMTKYNVLEQTGISALSQSNQMQQSLLKLLQ